MKKFLFLAVFGVFCLFLAGNAEAGFKGSYCTPSPNHQFRQLNWIHENGGIFTGHLGSTRGSWTPPPACYRPPQQSYDNQYPTDRYPRHDRRYDRHDRRHGGNDALTNALASFLGAFAGSAVGNQVYQQPPAPVTPPQPAYTPPPSPVYSAPARRESCGPTTCIFVSGGSEEARLAVRRAALDRKYTLVDSRFDADYELRIVSERSIGDPIYRLVLEMVDIRTNRIVSSSDGSSEYRLRSEWSKLEAISNAARTAVGNL